MRNKFLINSNLIESLQAVTVLALISCAVLGLAVLFFLISLIDRFKRKSLNLFIGVLLMANAVVISGVIIVYTLLYAKDAKMTRKFNYCPLSLLNFKFVK